MHRQPRGQTQHGRRPPRAIGLLLGLLLVASCAQAQPNVGGPVRFLGAWEGTELDAFLAVLAPFEERTGVTVIYTATRDLARTLDDALERGSPPDVAGIAGPAHLQELASTGALRDLSSVIDLQTYKQEVAPTFIELGTVDGRLVGAFGKSTLKGLVWYNPATFRRGTPHTFAELGQMAQTSLASRTSTREWCVGLESREASGWPATDWIELFLLHQAGLEVYDQWVAGELPWTADQVRRAFESYGQVVAEDAVYGGATGARETAFEEAGGPLFTQPPGCLLMVQGSFMPSFFEADGWQPGTDFDFFPFPDINPDSTGEVIGAGDLLGLFSDAPAAEELVRYLVGAEAQQIWVSSGGALSVNRAVDDYPNDLVLREAGMLSGAEHFRFDGSDRMPTAMNEAFWHAALDFTANQDRLPQILDRLEEVRGTAYDR
jgi:alpha-glucoside transport system substrate-binding protein